MRVSTATSIRSPSRAAGLATDPRDERRSALPVLRRSGASAVLRLDRVLDGLGGDVRGVDGEVEVDLRAHVLTQVDLTGRRLPAGASESAASSRSSGRIPSATLRPSYAARPPRPSVGSACGPKRTCPPAISASTRFIAGEPMKSATKRFTGSQVEVCGFELLQLALAHHGDQVPERHRLGLVVRHVDRRHAERRWTARSRRASARGASRRGSTAARP